MQKQMTLKQLIDSTPFEEIAPFIKVHDEGRNPLVCYKQHYDYLRHLAPAEGEAGEVRVSLCRNQPWSDDKADDRLFIGTLEGEDWTWCLAQTLALDDDVKASAAELAACCLWHTSFYAFLPYELSDALPHLSGEKARLDCFRKKYADIIPPRREMLTLPSFHQRVRRAMRAHRGGRRTRLDRELDMPGLRRERWRYWKRYETNEEYFRRVYINSAFIEDALERGTDVTEAPARETLGRLYLANHVSIHRCDTFAYDASARLEYLRELVVKYGLLADRAGFRSCFVCISASPEHPLTATEVSEAESLVASGQSGERVVWIKADGSLGEEMRVDVAYYE